MNKALVLLCSLAAASACWAEPVPVHLSAAPDQAVRQVLQDVKSPGTVPIPPDSQIPEEEDEGGSVVPS